MISDQTTVMAGSAHYKARSLRRILILSGMTITLFLSFAVDLATGPANYPLADVIFALLNPSDASDQLRVVIWEIRMPVALMALTVGAALSTAGAQMQTILANPLASPFTLGISAAAGFGAALALVLGVAILPAFVEFIIPINAFLMAMATALIIHFFSRMRGVTVETIVLLGIALVFTFNALLALLQYLASEQALAAVVFWTMGSLVKAT
jgi:iron complex transport system permease protein